MIMKNVLLSMMTIFSFAGFVSSALAAAPTGTCGLVASMPHPEFDW